MVAGFYLYGIGLASLDSAAGALGRKVDEHTLEYLNLEFYRINKALPLAYAYDLFEAERKMRVDVAEATKDYDIVLTPTMPCTALRHGTDALSNRDLTPDDYIDADAATWAYGFVFSVTGQPSVSLPLFQDSDGLPIGIQIAGRFGDEATLVRLARDLEEAIPWAARRPPIFAGSTE